MPQLKNFHKLEVVEKEAALTQLQGDIATQAMHEEKLAELQKQHRRETLKDEVAQGIQQLTFLADRINALGNQLEAEMLYFKQIAIETNRAYRAIQQPSGLKAIDKRSGGEAARFIRFLSNDSQKPQFILGQPPATRN